MGAFVCEGGKGWDRRMDTDLVAEQGAGGAQKGISLPLPSHLSSSLLSPGTNDTREDSAFMLLTTLQSSGLFQPSRSPSA